MTQKDINEFVQKLDDAKITHLVLIDNSSFFPDEKAPDATINHLFGKLTGHPDAVFAMIRALMDQDKLFADILLAAALKYEIDRQSARVEIERAKKEGDVN